MTTRGFSPLWLSCIPLSLVKGLKPLVAKANSSTLNNPPLEGGSKAKPSGRGNNLYNNSSHNFIKNTFNPPPNGIKPLDKKSCFRNDGPSLKL